MTTSLQSAAATPPRFTSTEAACARRRRPFPAADRARSSASPQPCSPLRRAGGATAAETEVSQAVGQSVTVRQRRGRDHRVQPRQGHRRHRLRRPAARPREHRRFFRRRGARHRRQGARHRALHRGGSGRRARRSATGWRARLARSRSLPSVGPCRSRRRSSSAARPKPRRSPSIARITNTEGATVSRSESEFVYANTHGFSGGYRSSRHHIDCAVDRRGRRRDAARLLVHGRARGRRPRGGGRRSAAWPASAPCAGSARASSRTLECPVLFEAPEAADLIGYFVGAVSGGSLYRKSSFLLDSLGQQVFAPHVNDPRGAAPAARARQRAVRQRRRGDRRRATSCSDGVCRAISSAAIRRASSAWRRPATPAAATTSSSRTATTICRRCCAAWAAACSSPSSSGRASIR